MATRIREFAWADHPFGPPETWPLSLRSALGICLNSAFPTAIYWGPDLRLLYNDAWSTIPGPRHPACLGEPAREVWADIWHVIEPQFIHVIETGEGLFVDDQLLPMRRFGLVEETYWSYSFTPIRGEDGSIEGIFNSGQETTAKVLTRRETAFLLKLNDGLRAGTDPGSMMDLICGMLGTHLQAARVGIREIDPLTRDLAIRSEWTADGVEPAGSIVPWASMDSIARTLARGNVVRIDCTEGSAEPDVRMLAQKGAASVLAIPAHRAGELHSVIFVHRASARPWSDEEVATVEHAFAVANQAIEEERTALREQAMMREIDHRARNMLGVSQALIRLVRADDIESFRASVLDRISSLAKTLGLLSESKWVGARLSDLLEGELAPYLSAKEPRASLQGPPVILDPALAQPVAMAIHELVTNALKYGALATPDGSLSVSWTLRDNTVLDIDWTETSTAPRATAASGGSGFGTKLLQMTIESQLRGKLTRRLDDQGFHCRIEIPLPRAG
ncbi:HWE histidine kinase domain-containing protein [Zhengella mangrovi]|nr:HWE histidine kinase domain-containing protein [Zhengella mangrovi]